MEKTLLASNTKLNTNYEFDNSSSIINLASYNFAWNKFKKWYDRKFFPLNESRFLCSGFLNQQGYLISFLKSCGVNLSVYWEVTSNMWVACINAKEVDYNENYDNALLSAITKGFLVAEVQ